MCTFVADIGALQLIFAHAHHVLQDRLVPSGPHHLPCSKYKKGINSKVFFELSLNRSKIVRQLLGPRTAKNGPNNFSTKATLEKSEKKKTKRQEHDAHLRQR